eukprot:CAMPEP_0202920222 /NCGR_PEP_ID=MMETSP1392-20130828/76744_2 /ASSEMBLY_ACC=CAM_ASM_000868 /TAXON_ID=225041 /ORGANISM="Chlamydomonas chlamydogama, Strain SAG 11-48b" /LENGTH=107 /DNA_ID=CAMNT_0049613707 /DNA_START=1077 /DNA_END=1397 /DNA_ORIENTATION=-
MAAPEARVSQDGRMQVTGGVTAQEGCVSQEGAGYGGAVVHQPLAQLARLLDGLQGLGQLIQDNCQLLGPLLRLKHTGHCGVEVQLHQALHQRRAARRPARHTKLGAA